MSNNKTIAEQESKIKDSLFEFIKKYIPDADLSLVDEIVLSYVVAILEDVSSDPVFDVEGLFFFGMKIVQKFLKKSFCGIVCKNNNSTG